VLNGQEYGGFFGWVLGVFCFGGGWRVFWGRTWVFGFDVRGGVVVYCGGVGGFFFWGTNPATPRVERVKIETKGAAWGNSKQNSPWIKSVE